jgi:hypothetical protein
MRNGDGRRRVPASIREEMKLINAEYGTPARNGNDSERRRQLRRMESLERVLTPCPFITLLPNHCELLARLIDELRTMSTAVDFDALVADGVLRADRDGWWLVLDPGALPPAAACKITAIERLRARGVRVRFARPSLHAALEEAEELAARWAINPPEITFERVWHALGKIIGEGWTPRVPPADEFYELLDAVGMWDVRPDVVEETDDNDV